MALAAIQGLNQKLEVELQEKSAEIEELKRGLKEMQAELRRMEKCRSD